MITDYDGNKMTPKIKAQELLAHKISTAASYILEELERDQEYDGEMTAREIQLVAEHVRKQADRCCKLLGYSEGSWHC